MAENNAFLQEKLRDLIQKEKEIQEMLEQARQEAEQKITSAHQKAAGIKKSAREEAEKQAEKIIEGASCIEAGAGKSSENLLNTENPPDEDIHRAARFLVHQVMGKEGD